MTNIPTATYRIQMRDGVDFERVTQLLPYLSDLGVSHLYLSPIFLATTGSTHGYDITDPTRIDPALGGPDGFDRLAAAARDRGLGIILDIVPNHTAFTLENPWLLDVLKQGQASRYARHFDIDWAAGPLVLPFLPEPFEKMLSDGAFRVADGMWHFGDVAIPLAEDSPVTSDLRALHDNQHWRLVHYALERDGITHRRFFNVTSLIGMRVEDRAVFEDTHSLIFDLVRQGQVQGLRVDHIDGLADPATYLRWLNEALPDTPVWVEKILVGDETLPPEWPTVGTTGYEAARLIAQLLTDASGIDRLDGFWREATGISTEFREELRQAKLDVLDNELAAERRQLGDLAALAAQGSALAEPGPESLREAVTALLVATPRYRTYVTDSASPEDQKLLHAIAEDAAQGLRDRAVLDLLADLMANPESDAARAFVRRFQQVSGALLAKAQEDTAGFRWTRYLPANEVGAEPDEPAVSADHANAFLAARRAADMTLVSTHDTKRSGDSRMRLVAISHLPDDFHALFQDAAALPSAQDLEPRWQWYVVQAALAVWDGQAENATYRVSQHIEKAMREAKLTSFWTNPDEAAENAAKTFARDLMQEWQARNPPALQALIHRGQALSFAQLAIQMLMPGFPDIYRGDENGLLALTDPDNRLPVDWDALAAQGDDPDAKLHWTRQLLALRRDQADFLEGADAQVQVEDDGAALRLIRSQHDRTMTVEFAPGGAHVPDAFLARAFSDGSMVSVRTRNSR
ncbi:malto-oligosyltrehalose synthase [Paracoccus aerius]|uniref:Malto-oligosyltrehalose synthase n=1 Tax=Paracoccus aerius TaxID=1915382 RepID=A0ABS1S548_9RHOB|nr:malto-oligosyltrehalose synthase [Paracoccus aerius]MBL3673710.1 malto-oligosyltrehalose synthase [Paracoccus aerius]GHG22789.1 malto-oligosyltrehalose synthase [Paracoccus aerius]